MDTLPPEELLVHTLALLEYRLERLEFVLNGGDSKFRKLAGDNAMTIVNRLQAQLGQLVAKNPTIEQLLKLQAKHPELFKHDEVPKPDEPQQSEKLALVLSEAPAYASIASQLRQLSDLPLPLTSSFTHLISQVPRFAAIHARQERQAREIAALRKSSALLVSRWYEIHVLGVGRAWADTEYDLMGVERAVGKAERAKAEV